MIGWYADIGTCTSSVLFNLDQVDFLDYNKPVGMLYVPDFMVSLDFIERFDDPSVAYDTAKMYIGLEVDRIFGAPRLQSRLAPDSHRLASYESFRLAFPSSLVSAPNTWNYLIPLQSSPMPTIGILIKSLSRFVQWNNNVIRLYSYDDDGNLTQLAYDSGGTSLINTTGNSTGNENFYTSGYIIKTFTHNSDFLNTANYACFYSFRYDYNSKKYIVEFDETTINLTRALPVWFGALDITEDAQPDFVDKDVINPYEPGGISGVGELPPGTFDATSDPIPDSPTPTLSAANTGFTRIYNPTLQQVQDLAKYLWTDDTVIETIWNHIKQYFEDPMQAIIGFNLVPVPVPDGGQQSFALMYIDTGVTMTVAGSQFVDVDCGTLALERYYGSALDQAPYTRITCFLPYIGQVDLDTDEVMGTTLQIKYRVDIVTGSCVAKIFVDGNCLYQYSGHCAINIPISSADFSSYVSAAISIAKLAGTAALAGSGVLPPPSPISTIQQTSNTSTTTTKDTSRNPATGRQITTGTRTISQDYNDKVETITTRASYDGLTPQNVTNTVGQIMGSKPAIQHSGSFSGNSGYLGVRRPYLIIQRPNMCLPENYQQLNGYPSMITLSLGSCKGYTQVQQVQLIGIPATNPEQAEILSLLKGGVIL